MRFFSIFALVALCSGWVRSDDFDINTVIHPVVSKLEAPKMMEGFGEGQMAITTSSDEAARHFAQGLAKMNTAWDFEAYRHFCEVVKLDPECMMGYWGIAQSLAGDFHEFFLERKAAVDRMLDLLESEKKEGKDRWNALETGFAQSSGFLLTSGVKTAGKTYQALAKKYPANIQARIFSLALQRDGFSRFGRPGPGQRRAEEGIRELLERYPENPSVKAFWIYTKCQDPGGVSSLKNEVLPVARQLLASAPDYPPYHLLLAQVESRCGNFREGLIAANRAVELYREYMKKEGVTVYDCDGLVRAQLFQADLLFLQGKDDEALAVAKELAGIKVDEKRLFSKGAVMLMWEARTLAARLMAARTTKEDFKQAQDIMAFLKVEDWFEEKSYAVRYRDCLVFYLNVRTALAEGKVSDAKKWFDQFTLAVRAFQETRPAASKTSSYVNWVRAMGTIAMLLPEARGMFSELGEGASREAAATWFRSALDRQATPVILLPPVLPYPMEWRLGEHYRGLDQPKEAASWYLKAFQRRANHPDVLAGLSKVADQLGKTDEAAALRKQIEAVRK